MGLTGFDRVDDKYVSTPSIVDLARKSESSHF